MKKYTVVAALMMLAAVAYSQNDETGYFAHPASYSHATAPKAERNYLACLSSTNEGVIESALAHVAMMKLMLPEGNYASLTSRVTELTRTAASPELRYKAFLTESVLANPSTFVTLARTGYATPDEFFGAVASRLGEYYSAR